MEINLVVAGGAIWPNVTIPQAHYDAWRKEFPDAAAIEPSCAESRRRHEIHKMEAGKPYDEKPYWVLTCIVEYARNKALGSEYDEAGWAKLCCIPPRIAEALGIAQ
jgi:hypothetical protein